MRRELHQLSAALKKSVPFHSPRYIGHMASDLLLPGLAAQILTLPYNPNNVSEDAAPVTVELEVQVGLQLAGMLGYVNDPARAGLRVRPPDLGRHPRQLPGAAPGAGAEGVPGGAAAAGVPDLELPEDDLERVQPAPARRPSRCWIAGSQWLAQAGAGRASALADARAGRAHRAARAGRVLRRASAP